jgi:hypothetical protein
MAFSHYADGSAAKISEGLKHLKIVVVELAVVMGSDPQGA